jgi:hypothetical protein
LTGPPANSQFFHTAINDVRVNYLFKKNNLEIFDAKEIPTHGGSIRVFCSRIGKYSVSPNVKKIYQYEKKFLNHKYEE